MRALAKSLLALFFLNACQQNVENQFKHAVNEQYSFQVDSILSLMTIEEKIGQLNQYSVGEEMTGPGAKNGESQIRYEALMNGGVGSVLNLLGAENTYKLQKKVVENTRLGIPLIFAYDVIHGYQTIFPIPLGEAASWDLEIAKKTAAIAAKEASAAGLHWTFAPMVDLSYDARWGRVMEGAGEDPYLVGLFSAARVNGFQGEHLSEHFSIAACAKHFAGYGFVESGKDYNNVNIDRSSMLNSILPPFHASVEAGAATIMTAFNDYESMPASGNQFLLRDVLKENWAFKGVVVSDWNSIGEMVDHRVAENNRKAAELALLAGTDIDMEANAYHKHLKELIESKELDEALLDDAVRRVLSLKYKLGLFDDPYRYSNLEREKEVIGHKEHHELAKEAALKSIVLLKNENDILPLKENEKIALIGPLVKDKDTPLGNWRAAALPESAVSVYEGISANKLPTDQLHYAEGCKLSVGPNNFFEKLVIENKDKSGFDEAIQLAKKVDKVVMVLGEPAYMSGEARSRADIGLPGLQMELLQEIYKVNKNIILVLMNGRPLTLSWEDANIPAIVETWHLGSQAGNAIADVLYGKFNPSGKLPMSFPRHVGQLPIRYNYKSSGRGASSPGQVFYVHHADVESTPLYPFGYGLSYTNFTFGEPKISKTEFSKDEEISISIKVTNSGKRSGTETVQLYIKDEVASITRPEKELKGFKKVTLNAGESADVEFIIKPNELGFYLNDLSYVVEAGTFTAMIGNNAHDLQAVQFELK